jgi:hypothetical protein
MARASLKSWALPAVLFVAAIATTTPTQACVRGYPLEIEDVTSAQAVVIGRIVNYRLVLFPRIREARDRILANSETSPEVRERWENPKRLLMRYSAFDVEVERVLAGDAPKTVDVTWSNSTFGQPETMPGGLYLIALAPPNLEQSSGRHFESSPELGVPVVLQSACAPAFLFPIDSPDAVAIRTFIEKRPK